MNGPFVDERAAYADAVELAEGANRTAARIGRVSSETPITAARAILEVALDGIELGEYDRRIVEWLKGWEVGTLVVLGGIIERAKAMQP